MNTPRPSATPSTTPKNRLAALFAPSSIRWERVLEARRKIANGDYEHPRVMSAVADRLLDEIDH